MSDKIFVDSNIWLYLFSEQIEKKRVAEEILLGRKVYISTQVLSENANVLLKKLKVDVGDVRTHIAILAERCEVVPLVARTVQFALAIHEKYQFSFYDSQILASALMAGCTKCYSEDMQHNQQVESLVIQNPFKMEEFRQ